MKVPFFYVIKNIVQISKLKNIDTNSGHFAIRHSSKSGCYIISLPIFHEMDFIGLPNEWINIEQHLTYFELQQPEEKVMSNYHYSGVFQRVGSTNEAVKIRIYFDKNHEICLGAVVWSFDLKTQKIITPCKNFLSSTDNVSFLQGVKNLIAPLIITLETKQKKILNTLGNQYNQIVTQMEEMSSTQEVDAWEPKCRSNFLALADRCIGILEETQQYSDEPSREQALINIFKQYHTIQAKVESAIPSIAEDLDDAPVSVASQSDDTAQNTKKVIAIQTHREIEREKCRSKIHALLSSVKPLFKQKNKILEAQELHRIHGELNKLIIEDHGLDNNSCFTILDVLLRIRSRLENYCIYLLQDKHDPEWKLYHTYLRSFPEGALQYIIQNDDSDSLRFLLDNNLISLSTSMKDAGESTQSDFIYNIAYTMQKVQCILLFVEKGIPPITMVYNKLQQVILGGGESNSLERTLAECLKINHSFVSLVPFEHLSSVLDQSMCFMLVLRKRECEKEKSHHLKHAIKTIHHKRQNTLNRGFFGSAQSAQKDAPKPYLVLIDIGIELLKIVRFFDSMWTMRPDLFKELMFKNSSAQKVDDTQSIIDFASKILASDDFNTNAHGALQLMRFFTSKLEKMHERGYRDQFFRALLLLLTKLPEKPIDSSGALVNFLLKECLPLAPSLQKYLDISFQDLISLADKITPIVGAIQTQSRGLDSQAQPQSHTLLSSAPGASLMQFLAANNPFAQAEDDDDDVDASTCCIM